jgi:signal transduction histidine kinase
MLEKALGQINAEQEKVLGLAKKEIERLSQLINDILDLSKIEAGQLQLKPTVFQASDLLRQTAATFELWAKSKKVVLEIKIPAEPIEMKADPARLTQVLTNLMGNALKHTPSRGKVTLEVKKVRGPESSSPSSIQFSVQDTGPGISKKDQKRIFEKFVQLDSPAHTEVTGTGLGLAISKEMVELHGGRIWVEGEEGKGSRFIFEIPCPL